MQKRFLIVALLGLSIAVSQPTKAQEVTAVNAQVDISNNALTQRPRVTSRRSNHIPLLSRTSWYRHGRITANGETFDPQGITVAHKTLPFNTLVRFTNPEN